MISKHELEPNMLEIRKRMEDIAAFFTCYDFTDVQDVRCSSCPYKELCGSVINVERFASNMMREAHRYVKE